MNIIIIAVAAVCLTGAVFIFMDRKQPRERTEKAAAPAAQPAVAGTGPTDYTTYVMPRRDKLVNILLAALGLFTVGYIFYHNVIVASILVLLAYFFPRYRARQIAEKRRDELAIQFKQALYTLSSSLAAGRSVENAFKEVSKDLELIYPDPNTDILREFETINHRVANGEPIEAALLDFSNRAGIEDIKNFTDVFITCKRRGGNLNEVIRRTSSIISDKMDIQQEIQVLMAQKRFESKAVILAPILVVALFSYSSPDYMQPLYQLNRGGPLIMTGALVVMGLCYLWIQNIMKVKV